VNSNVIYSDEILNAYIDNELDQNDYVNISSALVTDQNLRTRVEDLRAVRSLVKECYQRLDSGSIDPVKSPNNKAWLSIAASMILMLGILTGWLINQYSTSPTLFDIAHTIENRSTEKIGKSNIMLHLSSKNRYRWKVVLDEIEQTLISANKKDFNLQVHLVTNGEAIKVAHLDNNPFASRIQNMMNKYPNFTMQVCRQTLERLYYSKNRSVKLLPGAEVVRSALGEIIKKRQQGWLYLKI